MAVNISRFLRAARPPIPCSLRSCPSASDRIESRSSRHHLEALSCSIVRSLRRLSGAGDGAAGPGGSQAGEIGALQHFEDAAQEFAALERPRDDIAAIAHRAAQAFGRRLEPGLAHPQLLRRRRAVERSRQAERCDDRREPASPGGPDRAKPLADRGDLKPVFDQDALEPISATAGS
jgi:hypothetical protein